MTDWVTEVVQALGYAGIALLTLLENIFPPIPSELIMPLAGYSASRGRMSLAGAILAGSAGSLAGCTAWYYVGRRIGPRRLRDWIEKYGRWLTLSNADVDKAEEYLARRGAYVVFVGRLIPGIRTWISVPAGLHRMPLPAFLAYSAAGTTLWTTILTAAGYWLGANFQQIDEVLGPASTVVFLAIGVWYVVRLIKCGVGRKPPHGLPNEAE